MWRVRSVHTRPCFLPSRDFLDIVQLTTGLLHTDFTPFDIRDGQSWLQSVASRVASHVASES